MEGQEFRKEDCERAKKTTFKNYQKLIILLLDLASPASHSAAGLWGSIC
jgi:hypothetical protein